MVCCINFLRVNYFVARQTADGSEKIMKLEALRLFLWLASTVYWLSFAFGNRFSHLLSEFNFWTTGMIGSHVAKELVRQRKFRVIGASLLYKLINFIGARFKYLLIYLFWIPAGLVRPRSNLDSLTSILTRIELVIGDITDPFRMIDVINSTRPKFLYHFAAQGWSNLIKICHFIVILMVCIPHYQQSTAYRMIYQTWPWK